MTDDATRREFEELKVKRDLARNRALVLQKFGHDTGEALRVSYLNEREMMAHPGWKDYAARNEDAAREVAERQAQIKPEDLEPKSRAKDRDKDREPER